MSKLQKVFEGKNAFIAYITAGDPTLATTEQLVLHMAEAGVDLIELGIPFSDPVAEGPVIQGASARALAAGTTIEGIFSMVQSIRRQSSVALAFMTYANPVYCYGSDAFMQRCREHDVCAVIIPDLPFEEREEILPSCKKYGIELISMIAPTSKERIQRIAKEAEGFVYCVSSVGVTGMRKEIGDEVKDMIAQVKEVKNIPCAVGFGISTPAQAEKIARFSDGVIVGSAIVKIIEEHGRNSVKPVLSYIGAMRKAI